MKKILLSLFSIVLCLSVYSQDNSKIEYSASSMYYVTNDLKTNNAPIRTPLGKDVHLLYDTFFKGWEINFIDKEGERRLIVFDFVALNPDNSSLVSDAYHNSFTAYNYILNGGTLSFMSNKSVEGYVYTVSVEDIIKK